MGRVPTSQLQAGGGGGERRRRRRKERKRERERDMERGGGGRRERGGRYGWRWWEEVERERMLQRGTPRVEAPVPCSVILGVRMGGSRVGGEGNSVTLSRYKPAFVF